MNTQVRSILQLVTSNNTPALQGLLDVSSDEKKTVLYIYSKLKTSDKAIFDELRAAKAALSFTQCTQVLGYFSGLLTKYPALNSFTELLITEVVLK